MYVLTQAYKHIIFCMHVSLTCESKKRIAEGTKLSSEQTSDITSVQSEWSQESKCQNFRNNVRIINNAEIFNFRILALHVD